MPPFSRGTPVDRGASQTISPERFYFLNMVYQPKECSDNGRTLQWGKDISEDDMELLRQGEIFTLVDDVRTPKFKILMDSYNVIREKDA